jgi:hypothetical protein
VTKATFVAGVHGLVVTSSLGRGDRFFDDLLITNDPQVAAELLPLEAREVIGKLETEWLLEAETIVYGHLPWRREEDTNDARVRLLVDQLGHTRMLLKALWLIRDNCANTELGFLITPPSGRGRFGVTSNSLSLYFTKCDAESKIRTTFSREELREARLFVTETVVKGFAPDLKTEHEWVNRSPRLWRAMFFVEAARITKDLSVKIANYCTAFECLFATDTSELTHRLGERLARFLGADLPERKEIYRRVKHAYEVRSKAVHGAPSRVRYDALVAISVSCDDLLRKAMRKILANEELHGLFASGDSDQTVVNEYFLDLTLA